MRTRARILACLLAASQIGLAHAGEEPLYRPAPDWLKPAAAIDPAKAASGAPVVLFDLQQRIENGQVWTATDVAFRADTPESITQMGTIAVEWTPDQGDLMVHRVEILRGGETVDVLKSSKFTVLRREQQLERRVMLGTLTGTLTVPGLRVGDILRYSVSVTQVDKALGGKVQALRMLPAAPSAAQFGRARASWPATAKVRYRGVGLGDGAAAAVRREGAYQVWETVLPAPPPPELPDDAPERFKMPPNVQFTDFADWRDVSRTMAPLFASRGLIPAGHEIAAEVAAIKAATSDPVERAAKALEVVQSRIAYMLFGMNGGNYIPQTPEQTWASRLGDCKAKTLLLLAMLEALGIEAEPVLARTAVGDALPDILPMAAAFDHVLVHARIGGEDFWLDGTDAGTRLADLRDVPPLRYVLPLRPEGAELVSLPAKANARPDHAIRLTLDQSAGAAFPNIVDLEVQTRGALAAKMQSAWLQAPEKQRAEMASALAASHAGEIRLADYSFVYDQQAGLGLFKARGLTTTSWKMERGRYRQALDFAQVGFAPDRARPAWQSIPAATGAARTMAYDTRIILPEGGRGVVLDGDSNVDAVIAGAHLKRSTKVENGIVTLVERVEWTGAEIAPSAIAAERAKAATASARSTTLVAPEDAARSVDYAAGPARKKLQPYDEIYAAIIAKDPDDPEVYRNRASFRRGILDHKGALADLDKALALQPDASLHLMRAGLLATMGDKAGAANAARHASELEPDNLGAFTAYASSLAEAGQKAEALTLIQKRIDEGGKDRFNMMAAKADILANGGDAVGAITVLDAAIAGRPGDPLLLNARCWIKGTGNLALDSALIDCTKAIQLSDNTAPILDSRAMAYFRLGKFEDALSDYDAALEAVPNLTPTRYMRGIVLKRLGRGEAGQADIDQAKRLDPNLAGRYGKYGISP